MEYRRGFLEDWETVPQLVRGKDEVKAHQDIEPSQTWVCIKVLAAVSVMHLVHGVAVWFTVQLHIACNWNIPEDGEMEEDEHAPVKEVFGSLLLGNFSSRIIKGGLAIFICAIHIL